MSSSGGGAGRAGMAYGLAAFGLWGLLPLYWHELDSTPAAEVLAHRMVWSVPTAVALLLCVRSWSWIRPLLRQPRRLALLAGLLTLGAAEHWLLVAPPLGRKSAAQQPATD